MRDSYWCEELQVTIYIYHRSKQWVRREAPQGISGICGKVYWPMLKWFAPVLEAVGKYGEPVYVRNFLDIWFSKELYDDVVNMRNMDKYSIYTWDGAAVGIALAERKNINTYRIPIPKAPKLDFDRFVEEHKNDTYIAKHPKSDRVKMQCIKEQTPELYKYVCDMYPKCKQVVNYAVPAKIFEECGINVSKLGHMLGKTRSCFTRGI